MKYTSPEVEFSKMEKKGVPTPINEGTLTPNQEAFGLLVGFASGSVCMEGDVVQHLPIVQGNKTFGDSLGELPWFNPNTKTKQMDLLLDQKRLKLLKRKPVKSKAKTLAKKNPQTWGPDSDIRIENIIPGSPVYIPCKKGKSVNRGKGKGSKGSKNLGKMQSHTKSITGMAHTKQKGRPSRLTTKMS